MAAAAGVVETLTSKSAPQCWYVRSRRWLVAAAAAAAGMETEWTRDSAASRPARSATRSTRRRVGTFPGQPGGRLRVWIQQRWRRRWPSSTAAATSQPWGPPSTDKRPRAGRRTSAAPIHELTTTNTRRRNDRSSTEYIEDQRQVVYAASVSQSDNRKPIERECYRTSAVQYWWMDSNVTVTAVIDTSSQLVGGTRSINERRFFCRWRPLHDR